MAERVGPNAPGPAGGEWALPVERLRQDFPALSGESSSGAPLVYLDNAATTQKPSVVIDAVADYYRRGAGNVQRGAHTLGARASDAYEAARVRVQGLLNAAAPEEIVLTAGCTAAINLVAHTWGDAHVGAGDEVIVTCLEHHSNLLPWQSLCARRGARLRLLPVDASGALPIQRLVEWLSPRTRLVALAHVSNTIGVENPVAEVAALAHGVGACVLVDGAQAVSRLPVDVRALGSDFYVFSGHKLYAPAGVGALYARGPLLRDLPPVFHGGGMVDEVGAESSTFAPAPQRFEPGTPNVEGAIGLSHAIDYVQAVGLAHIRRHELELTRYARDALSDVPGVRVIGDVKDALGVLSFVLEPIHPHDLSTVLDQSGVAVRAGQHCAALGLAQLGVAATVRASFALYNTRADVDALIAGLRRARRVFLK